MGKGRKKRREHSDWEEMAGSDSHGESVAHSGNGSYGETWNGNGKEKEIDSKDDRKNSGNIKDKGAPDPQAYPNFGPYLDVVEDLKAQMLAGQKAMNKVHIFFARQQRDIQNAIETQRQLTDMKKQCKDFKTTIKTLRSGEREKDEEVAEKMAIIQKEKEALKSATEDVLNYKKELEEDKEKTVKRLKTIEAEQEVKLHEQSMELQRELDEKYEKRANFLERETKKRQDDDMKRILELDAINIGLSERLKQQKGKLEKAESKLKDAEKLKTVYEEEAEKLKEDLKRAENEFELNAELTESYKEDFLKVRSDIQNICSRFIKELQDLNALHDRMEQADQGFAHVPISTTNVSAELRVAHAQRVIAAQLQDIIWQPFSSETTQFNPEYVSLFRQISEGLMNYYGKEGGLRAVRQFTALTMRGLRLQPQLGQSLSTTTTSTSLLGRAEVFSDKVMAVLSPLIKSSQHPNFRNSLLSLAESAISVWDSAQTDEREVIVEPDLDPASFPGWTEDIIEPQNGVLVLFPRITARSCSRITDSHPVVLPGGWVEQEPKFRIENICVYDGEGLAKWSEVVMEGEEEEYERKAKEQKKKWEEDKRILEEKLKTPAVPKRRMSQNKNESNAGPVPRPSTARMMGSGQRIDERLD